MVVVRRKCPSGGSEKGWAEMRGFKTERDLTGGRPEPPSTLRPPPWLRCGNENAPNKLGLLACAATR
jgi:hypothetical protein